MAIALIVVGFLVTLVGGPSFVDHASKTQVTKFLQEEQSSQQGATLTPVPGSFRAERQQHLVSEGSRIVVYLPDASVIRQVRARK